MNFAEYLEENCDVALVSGGKELLVLEDCPFCGSFGKMYTSTTQPTGICFKCPDGNGFSAVSFVAAFEGVSKRKAFAILSGSGDRYESTKEEKESEELERWFPPCSPLDGEAARYMQARGFTEEFCRVMDLWYCTQNVQTRDGRIHYTANRVIILIKDREGQAIGWQGRDITGRSKIRYFIQPDFKGSEHLYNLHRVAAGEPIIIVEWVMDAWGWIKAGFDNVVATFGKKISTTQIKQVLALKPGVVYLAWDGGTAIEKAAFNDKYGHLFEVKNVAMGEKDADELETAELQELYAKAGALAWDDGVLSLLSEL